MIIDTIKDVASHHGLTAAIILSNNRTEKVVYARHEAMYWAYYYGGYSYSAIGRVMKRDHSSVSHGVKSHFYRIVNGSQIRSWKYD